MIVEPTAFSFWELSFPGKVSCLLWDEEAEDDAICRTKADKRSCGVPFTRGDAARDLDGMVLRFRGIMEVTEESQSVRVAIVEGWVSMTEWATMAEG